MAEEHRVVVRDMRREDAAVVHRMIHELAKYEGEPDGPKLSVEDLVKDGFESSCPWFFGLIAEIEGQVVGHALCNRAYSCWTRCALYVESIYVSPTARSAGVGVKLMQRLCQMALEWGAHRIDWHVRDSNELGLRFYAKLGAVDLRTSKGRSALRLERRRIEAVAAGDLLSPPQGSSLADGSTTHTLHMQTNLHPNL